MIYDLAVDRCTKPADWSIEPLDAIADVVGGGTPDTNIPEYWNPPEIAWVTPTDITASPGPRLSATSRSISSAGLRNCSAELLPAGTTLLTSRATIGECRIAGVPVATNQGFASLVPKDGTDSKFLFYLAQSLKPVFVRLAAGTTFVEVSRREIRRIRVCIPSDPAERAEIGRILTIADDALAVAGEKLTNARRLKTALMQRIFTRGIPGRHTRFKETRIGEVPDDWEVMPLHRLATAVSGIALNSDRQPRFHPRRYLTVINVQRERLDLTEVRQMEVLPHEIPNALLEENDIVVVEGHANTLEIGRAALITHEAVGFAYQNHLFRVRLLPNVEINQFFLLYVLNSERVRRHWAATCNTSSGLNTINHRGLRRLPIVKPQPEEQEEIVAMMKNANDSISSCEAELAAVSKLKSALLQNLLTGRARVKVPENIDGNYAAASRTA